MKAVILDPHDVLFDGVVSSATLPGMGGEKTFLDNHESLFLVLTKGVVVLQSAVRRVGRAESRTFRIRRGLARMRHNVLTILVE
jgi:F-type H+-transporting ATPase subunit epsilon